jgi:predicted O-methyltransferase YrrM
MLFDFGQKLGVHVVPVHFYEPIPDTRSLKEVLWSKDSEMIGVDLNVENQFEMLSRFKSKFKGEYDGFAREKTSIQYEYHLDNHSFISVDAELLYCMIRDFRPRRIFEVGSGNSTYVSAQAILKNKAENLGECELTVIDPYPNEAVKAGFPGLARLLENKVEDIEPSKFDELGENDILFIDSSHVLRIGNDVQFLYLEILPRLKKGVIVHIHDVFLPSEYPREWILEDHFFWNEQYLLQAFLSFNDSFEVLWSASYMNHRHADKLEEAFSSYRKREIRPCSFWIRKTR